MCSLIFSLEKPTNKYHFTSWSHQLCHLLQAVDKFRVSQIQSPPHCQSLLQISSVTILHSDPIGLHSNLTILTRPQLYLLAEENSDLLNAPNMRTVLHKHSQSHFTVCLQIFHQSMLLQVMLKKTTSENTTPVTLMKYLMVSSCSTYPFISFHWKYCTLTHRATSILRYFTYSRRSKILNELIVAVHGEGFNFTLSESSWKASVSTRGSYTSASSE